jgi:hypothetical protein
MARGKQAGCACRVTLAEVAGVLGVPTTAGLARPDEVAPDWRGDPSVAVDVAARIVADVREQRERERRDEEWVRAEAEGAQLAETERLQAVWLRAYNEFVARHPEYEGYAAGVPMGRRRRTPSKQVDRAAREYANGKRREAMGAPA